MKRTSLLLLLTFSTISLFAQTGDWQTYNDYGFEILFPKKPAYSSQNVKTEKGNFTVEMHMYEPTPTEQDENIAYAAITILYSDTFAISNNAEMVAKIFRGAIDGGVNNIKGTILSETNIEYKSFPGRDVRVSFSNNNEAYIMVIHAFLLKNKMYILQVASTASNEKNISAKRFLSSFKLTE